MVSVDEIYWEEMKRCVCVLKCLPNKGHSIRSKHKFQTETEQKKGTKKWRERDILVTIWRPISIVCNGKFGINETKSNYAVENKMSNILIIIMIIIVIRLVDSRYK